MSNDKCYTVINASDDRMCVMASSHFQARRITRNFWAKRGRSMKIIFIKEETGWRAI